MTSKATVLILDDEVRILTSLEDLFEDHFDVLTTSSPETALEHLRRRDISVVLSDGRMPGMSGHAFLEKAKEISQATRLLFTGYTDIDALTSAINQAHIFGYINKPWDPRNLIQTIRQAAEHYNLMRGLDYERSLLHALMENIPDPIFIKDASGQFIKVNRSQAKLLGVGDPARCVGKREGDLVPFADAVQSLAEERRLLETGEAVAGRIEEQRRDEEFRWFSTTKFPILDRRGNAMGLVGISRDITQLKKTEIQLRDRNRLLKLILDSMGDAVLVSDESGDLALYNPAAEELFGLGGSAAFLDEGADGVPAESGRELPASLLPLAKALAGERIDGAEISYDHASGQRPIWISVTARALQQESGAIRGAVVVCREITERKLADEALQAAMKAADQANQAKSAFLAGMSHEIRTPMNAILGTADLLAETPLNGEQREYVSLFQRTGADLLTLIDQILDLSKIEAEHLELEAVEFDLELVGKKLEMMAARAQTRGIELSCEIMPDVPTRLIGDPNRLRQVLFNLLGNALKFTEKGRVRLRVECMEQRGNEATLHFSVSDTGIGISPEKLELIFDPFTQADGATTRKYGGTGLGLAISKTFVKLMGGSIKVESTVGAGSTFHFTLPFTVASGSTEEHPAPPRSGQPSPQATEDALKTIARRRPRILLAEDCIDNVFIAKAYLRGHGIHLDVVENGERAVAAFQESRPDLVLMDMYMPVMDGYTATQTIREWERSQGLEATPILALTAFAHKSGVSKSYEAGCTAHLTKPIARATLIDALYQHTTQLTEKELAEQPVPADLQCALDELKPGYLNGIRTNLEAMREAIERTDYTVPRTLGHQMAGSGGAYGLPEISKLGRAIEQAARGEDEGSVRAHLMELQSCLEL